MDSVSPGFGTPFSDIQSDINLTNRAPNSEEASVTPELPPQSSPTNGSKKPKKKKRVACVECRQQKSKCDAHDKAPEPCTRCQKKGVPCVLKKDFRRTYKRARNEAIEKRFKELTATLSNLSSEQILKRIEEEQQQLLDNSNFTKDKIKKMKDENMKKWQQENQETSIINSINYQEENSPMAAHIDSNGNKTISEENYDKSANVVFHFSEMTEEQLKCSPKNLGDVYVSSQQIAELFQEFATKYHIFLPVVNLEYGAEKIYNLSPCLFWVILLIGLRRKPQSTHLMKKLSGLVKSVLAEITISPIIRYTPSETDEPVLNVASVYSVQAFLLYTFWPPLTSSLSADTSWNTIGTAMFQAIRVGLNCADFSKEYTTANFELINEQLRTWVCCNIVSQFIASSFGFPSYTSFDNSILNSTSLLFNQMKETNIPLPLKQLTQIARFENQVINTISNNGTNVVGVADRETVHPLIQVLNQQLVHLDLSLRESNIDDIRKFSLLVAKTHLLTYYFNDPFLSEVGSKDGNHNLMQLSNKTEALFETKKGLVKAYNAAIEFLCHAHSMWKSNPTIIKYLPGVFVLNIWQSACIISKLANSSLAPMLDVAYGKKAYQNAVLLTFNASVLKHDMAYRSSGIMRSIWSLYANMYESWKKEQRKKENSFVEEFTNFNLGITVRSRMAVSVFFDCLYILKEKSGMAKLERESKRSHISGENDEKNDEDDESDSGIEKGTSKDAKNNDIKLSHVKNPEMKARRIIETIPLDPNPINVSTGSSNGSLTNTPNSSTYDNQSVHANTNNKMSPESYNRGNGTFNQYIRPNSDVLRKKEISKSLIRPPETSMFDIVRNQKPKITSDYRNATSGEFSERQLQNGKSTAQSPILNDNLGIKSSNDLTNQQFIIPFSDDHINTTPTNDSPNSIMANWDNWESDVVWKDVDILMNEFAFNPTL